MSRVKQDEPEDEPVARLSLHAVLAEYIRRREAGEPAEIESLCAAYPELADGLRSYAEGEGLLNALHDPAGVDPDHLRAAETLRPGASQRTDFAPQAEFGRYRLIRQLGNGAMGAVYLADDTQLARQVALKIPKGTGVEGPEYLKRFTRESRAAARLDHPNLCRIYDAGDVHGTPFISMEYIKGPPLSQCVGVGAYQDQRRIAEIVAGIAAGLQLAHERGILHRDVKSSNVLMKNGETPCVTDFGLARIEGWQESKLTQDGAILGTPAYMAPEQIRSELDRIGPHSDVYALGVVLYELLVGHTPFQGSVLVILNQVLHDRPQSLQKHRADVDPLLADFCLKMLEKEPDQRPQSMQEVVEFLHKWLKTAAPDQQLQQVKTEKERAKYEGMKSKILELIQRGQHAQAVAALEKMQNLQYPAAAEYRDWARLKLPQVKKLPQQLKQAIPALLATAKECLRNHDYPQAAQLLQDIPLDFRGAEVQLTLDQALELQEESELLLLSLQESLRTRQLTGIEANLNRFLQLRPGNRFAKELWESLQTYSKLPSKQRSYKFNEKGHLQPLATGSIWDNWLLMGTLCFAAIFGIAYWGITVYLKDGTRTLAVEVNDAWLREQGGSITLDVDGKEHTLTTGDVQIKVTFGEHGFSVRQGSTVVHNPQTFSIEKGDSRILHIDANGMHLAAARNPPPPSDDREQIADMSQGNRTPLVDGLDELALQLQGHTKYIAGIAFSPNGRFVVTSGNDNTIRVWDIVGKRELKQIHTTRVYTDLHFVDSGKKLLAASGVSALFDTSTWALIREYQTGATVECIAISPDETRVAAHSRDHQVYVWDMNSGQLIKKLAGVDDSKWALGCALPDNQHVIMTGPGENKSNREFLSRLVAINDGVAVKTYPKTPDWGAAAHLSNDQQYFLTKDWQGIHETAVDGSGTPRKFAMTNSTTVGYTPDNRHVFSGSTEGVLKVWDRTSGKEVHAFESRNLSLCEVAVSPDGRFLATGGGGTFDDKEPDRVRTDGDYSVKIWRLPQQVWPKLSSGTTLSGGPGLDGLSIGPGTKLTGTYIQQTPVATHDIVVTLKEQRGGVWHGEFESLRAHHPVGSEIKTGFKFSCELTVTSPTTASLRMTKIIGNTSGNTIRDTTANWVEELQWDGKTLSNNAVRLTGPSPISSVPVTATPTVSTASPVETLMASQWSIVPTTASKDWKLSGTTLESQRGADVSLAWTAKPYDNFDLTFEFQCSKNANGGIVLRAPKPHGFTQPVLEVHLGDGTSNLAANGFPLTGGIYLINEHKKFVDVPADQNAYLVGQWNKVQLTLIDSQLTVQLNNRVVLNRSLKQLATAYPDHKGVLEPNSGYIGLQSYTGTMTYRNLVINTRPIPPSLVRWNIPSQKTDTSHIVRGTDPFANENIPAGARWVDKQGIAFRWCPPGAYGAGTPPQSVRLTRGYWLSETEITQKHWLEVMKTRPWEPHPNSLRGPDYPASGLTHVKAIEFLQRKNSKNYSSLPVNCAYILPSEALWEYACRAGTTTNYYFGDNSALLKEHGWIGGKGPHEVALKGMNPWGFFDMYGNVGEIPLDTYHPERLYGTDPIFQGSINIGQIMRGGSWWGATNGSDSRPQRNPFKGNGDEGIRLAIAKMR